MIFSFAQTEPKTMNRPLIALLVALPVAAAPILAAAQVPPPTNRMPVQPNRMTANQSMSRFENEEQRRRLQPTTEEAEAQYGEARVELARQIAALVEQHKCDEARAMANAAGERQMALRIRRTCR
jgi:hypothetical protein